MTVQHSIGLADWQRDASGGWDLNAIPDDETGTSFSDLVALGYVQHNDLIIVCAYSYAGPLGGGGDMGTLQVSVGQSGNSGGESASADGGELCYTVDGWPLDITSSIYSLYGYVTSCIYNSETTSNYVNIGFTSPPTGLGANPPYANLIVVRNANSLVIGTSAGAQSESAWVGGNAIPMVSGSPGQADGRWYDFLVQFAVYQTVITTPASTDEAYGEWWRRDDPDPPNMPAGISDPADMPYPDLDTGSTTPTTDFFIADKGLTTDSTGGSWDVGNDTFAVDANITLNFDFYGASIPFQAYYDPDFNPTFPEPTPAGAEPFEFTHRWPQMGPMLTEAPAQAADLLERHDQELEEHFATHGCGDFQYTFRWPTFHHEVLAAAQDPARAMRVVDILERRDQELEEASAHQGEGASQVNDGSCVIELTHRWREIMPLVAAGDARAWDLLEDRDREIEEARSSCACVPIGGGSA